MGIKMFHILGYDRYLYLIYPKISQMLQIYTFHLCIKCCRCTRLCGVTDDTCLLEWKLNIQQQGISGILIWQNIGFWTNTGYIL